MNSLVSIIVPIFNAREYISECIISILSQDYQNFELILIDDGSKDCSYNICEEYSKKDRRIKLFKKENSGVSDTRNYGIKVSNGNYIMFVDADDILPSNAISCLVKNMLDSNAQAVFGNYVYKYDNRYIKRKPRIKDTMLDIGDLSAFILDDGTLSGILFGSVWGSLYKSQIIKDHNIKFIKDIKINEDGIFNIEYCLNSKRIMYLPNDYIYIYRQWKDQKSSNYLSLIRNFEIADNYLKNYLEHSFFESKLKTQLMKRRIFTTFQISISICSNLHMNMAKKELINLWQTPEVKKYTEILELDKMNNYKKILAFLMGNNCYLLFYLLIKNIYPLMAKFLKR